MAFIGFGGLAWRSRAWSCQWCRTLPVVPAQMGSPGARSMVWWPYHWGSLIAPDVESYAHLTIPQPTLQECSEDRWGVARGRIRTRNHTPCRHCDPGGSSYSPPTIQNQAPLCLLAASVGVNHADRELQEPSSCTTSTTAPSPGSSAGDVCLKVGQPMMCLSQPDWEVTPDTIPLAALFWSHVPLWHGHQCTMGPCLLLYGQILVCGLSLDCMLLCWLLIPLPRGSTCLVIP